MIKPQPIGIGSYRHLSALLLSAGLLLSPWAMGASGSDTAVVGSMSVTDLNQANQAELEMVKGVGPALSALALQQRQHGVFRDWQDAIQRLPGIGPARAKKLSDAGLRVNGLAYEPHIAASASAVTTAPPSR